MAVGLITYASAYGSRYSFSIFFPSLLEEFKWPRDITAAILSLHILIYGFTSPLAGYLVDRIGPRITMVLGAALLSLGLALSCLGTELWHFYLTFGALAGVGLCFVGAVPFTTVVKNWFERRRGLAFSIMSFGTGGAYALYPVVAWLIDHLGWRATFVVEGAVIAGLLIPLVILVIRYHPEEKGFLKDGAVGESLHSPTPPENAEGALNPELNAEDWTLPGVFKNIRFWMLALMAFSLWGVMDHILLAHHIAFAIDAGYSKIYASSVLSFFGLFRSLGALAGMISDRIGRERTLTIGAALAISGIVVLIPMEDTSQPWRLYYYALGFGFGIGVCAPTIIASIADIVQGPKVGLIIGLIWFSFAAGGAVGPWLAGWLFETTGHYRFAFMVAIAMGIVACVAIWIAAPRKARQRNFQAT